MDYSSLIAKVFARLGNERLLLDHRNAIYKLLNVCIDFISADGTSLKLSRGQNFNKFCVCMRKHPITCAACHQCDVQHARLAAAQKKPLIYSCHAGLMEIVVPLFSSDGKYLGCMTSGQFRLAGSDAPLDKLTKLAELCGCELQELLQQFYRSVTLTREQAEGLVDYLLLVGRLLASCYQNLLFMESVTAPDKINSICNYIKDNYSKALTVEHLAQKFYFTPNYFCRYFKKETGINCTAYLNSYRVEKAKEMLQYTDLSVSEVAVHCGFGSISQFNRVFRSIVRQSPRSFRNRNGSS